MPAADLDAIYDEVDRSLLEENISPRDDRAGVERVVSRVVSAYQQRAQRSIVAPLVDPSRTVSELVADYCDFGVLGEVFAMPGVEDVYINEGRIRYFQHGRWRAHSSPTTARRNRHVVMRLLDDAGVPFDESSPTVDGVQVLGGRGRLAGSIPPVSTGLDVTIRLFVARSVTLDDLVDSDTLPREVAELLSLDLLARGAVLICGETGSGKTTVMSGLLSQVDVGMRPVLIEEYREIGFSHDLGTAIQMKAGPPDRRLERSIAGLVRLSLRLHPDLIAVGEVRGPEAWILTAAASVGAAFTCTLHASSAASALERLARLAAGHEDRPDPAAVRETFSEQLHFVVHVERGTARDGRYLHQVTEVRCLEPPTDPSRHFTSEVLFDRPGGVGTPMRWTKLPVHDSVAVKLRRVLPPGSTLYDLLGGMA
jgi:pilus assembly protein CpaF